MKRIGEGYPKPQQRLCDRREYIAYEMFQIDLQNYNLFENPKDF